MAVKPILTVDVDDTAFRRFYDLFEQYSKEVEAMPESWRQLGDAMDGSTKGLESGAISAKDALALAAAQAGVIVEALEAATAAQHGLGRETKASARSMDGLAKGAQNVGKAISLVGGWIIKLGAIGGLGALFSGFGIGELANAAFSRNRAAGRLGIGPGQLASFQVNAQQFLGTSALEAAANAQIDISKAGALAALGISYRAAQALSTSDLAFQELLNARAAYIDAQKHGLPPMQMPAIMAYIASLGGNIGDVRNAALQPVSALYEARNATRRDAASLGFSQATAQAWTRLKITLDKAGLTIQSALIDRLAPLAPQIGILASDIADFIKTFLNSKDFGIIIADVKTGLKEVGTTLENIDWKKIGDDFDWIANKLGWIKQPAGTKKGNIFGPDGFFGKASDYPWNSAFYKNFGSSPLGKIWGAISGFAKGTGHLASQAALNAAGIQIIAARLGVNPILAVADAMRESGLHARAVGDKGSSYGIYQLHRGGELGNLTKEQAFDVATNATRALTYFAQAMRHHGNLSPGEIAALAQRPYGVVNGRITKAAFGYVDDINAIVFNTVSQAVDADIKKYGRSWLSHLPADVREYVNRLPQSERGPNTDAKEINRALKAVLRRKPPKPAQVSITNSTSARVAVSLNAGSIS